MTVAHTSVRFSVSLTHEVWNAKVRPFAMFLWNLYVADYVQSLR